MEEINFKVVQGDTFKIRVEYTDPDKNPINLTDFSAKMDVRNEPGGKILCAAINSSSGISIDGDAGVLDITFNPSQTRKFTTPSAAYQLKIISNGNQEENTILKGYFSVSPAVIR
jgi:hypothetical protein